MVYLINNVWCPHDKPNEVAKKYLEIIKKYPPDPALGTIVAILVRSNKDNVHVIGIGKVKKGKLTENIKRTTESNQMMANSIEGFKYEVSTYLDITEAYDILGMKAPDI
ncbi:MAG: hypothetical protein HWN66_04575 [Candidatus Helarchaeota archaeon]|nr:hypothetical protein [Candidatus Helarchaeota archaeon]